MNCGALNTNCNQKGYYFNARGKLAYQHAEDQTCKYACECVNVNPVQQLTAKPCPAPILGFLSSCEEAEGEDGEGRHNSTKPAAEGWNETASWYETMADATNAN
jgi:hypothetical protein